MPAIQSPFRELASRFPSLWEPPSDAAVLQPTAAASDPTVRRYTDTQLDNHLAHFLHTHSLIVEKRNDTYIALGQYARCYALSPVDFRQLIHIVYTLYGNGEFNYNGISSLMNWGYEHDEERNDLKDIVLENGDEIGLPFFGGKSDKSEKSEKSDGACFRTSRDGFPKE